MQLLRKTFLQEKIKFRFLGVNEDQPGNVENGKANSVASVVVVASFPRR